MPDAYEIAPIRNGLRDIRLTVRDPVPTEEMRAGSPKIHEPVAQYVPAWIPSVHAREPGHPLEATLPKL